MALRQCLKGRVATTTGQVQFFEFSIYIAFLMILLLGGLLLIKYINIFRGHPFIFSDPRYHDGFTIFPVLLLEWSRTVVLL